MLTLSSKQSFFSTIHWSKTLPNFMCQIIVVDCASFMTIAVPTHPSVYYFFSLHTESFSAFPLLLSLMTGVPSSSPNSNRSEFKDIDPDCCDFLFQNKVDGSASPGRHLLSSLARRFLLAFSCNGHATRCWFMSSTAAADSAAVGLPFVFVVDTNGRYPFLQGVKGNVRPSPKWYDASAIAFPWGVIVDDAASM